MKKNTIQFMSSSNLESLQGIVKTVLGISFDAETAEYVAECISQDQIFSKLSPANDCILQVATKMAESLYQELANLGVCRDVESSIQFMERVLVELFETTKNEETRQTEFGLEFDSETGEEEWDDLPSGSCEICYLQKRLAFHHLIPKMTHKRVIERGLFSKEECRTRGIMVCSTCHRMLHKTWTHMELALKYNSLERIMEDERMIKYQAWAAKSRKKKRVF